MEEIEAGDWKSRLQAYEHIIELMATPTTALLNQLQVQLPNYLADINPTCQKTALTICDLFFKSGAEIEYDTIAATLIDKCLSARQQNSDAAVPLVIQCLKNSREKVAELLFKKIMSKSPHTILAVISVVIAHLVSLTPKDSEEANHFIQLLTPLLQHNDPKIQKEASGAIESAKVAIGKFDATDPNSSKSPSKELVTPSKQPLFEGENSWPTLIISETWKDRKAGYELLLSLITPDFPLAQYENMFLNAINDEKHVACNEVAVQCIEKLALTFKSQLSRRLREYITPVLNAMKEKRQSRFSNLQSAFDAVALNIVSGSPYEQPFLEYILKMLTNQSIRLREEAVAFIIRCPVLPVSAPVQDQLMKMADDANLSVRDAVAKALTKIGLQKTGEIKIPEKQLQVARQRAKSPDTRRSIKRKPTSQTAVNVWRDWIEDETNNLLTSGQWNQVTLGLEQVRKQFEEDASSNPQAIAAGLSNTFIGKTFTPKVMANIVKDILFFIKKEDSQKMADDAISQVLLFALEKLPDKKLEQSLFELLDATCECNGGQYVFNFFYQHLGAKNPVIPNRIATYFAHYLSLQETSDIDIEGFSQQIKPLFTHSDQSVRKAANECLVAVSNLGGTEMLDNFKYVKAQQIKEAKERNNDNQNNELDKVVQLNEIPSDISDKEPPSVIQSNIPTKQKPQSSIPVPKRSQSPKKNTRVGQSPDPKSARDSSPEQRALFSKNILSAVTRAGSMLECKKGMEEVESMLTKMLEKDKANTIPYSDFAPLFERLRPWFKDSNTNIVLSVAKDVNLSLKLINVSDIANIPKEFFSDMMLLLNFTVKQIRLMCLQNMNLVYSMWPSFIPEVYLDVFQRLNAEGKIYAIRFLKDLNYDMDVQTYASFITNCIANKSDEFHEAANPIIIQFLNLPGAVEAVSKAAEEFPPAKKSHIKSAMQILLKKDSQQNQRNDSKPQESSLFNHTPTRDETDERISGIDPFLPLKILNMDEDSESLTDILKAHAETYFPETIMDTDLSVISSTCKMLLQILSKDFEHFSLILDIVFLWCAYQTLLMRQIDGFAEIIGFLESLLPALKEHDRQLTQYESSLITPMILECYGRNSPTWSRVKEFIFESCDTQVLLEVLVHILSIATSVFVLTATYQWLTEIIPNADVTPYVDDLRNSSAKILKLVSANKAENPEIFNAATEFNKFLEDYINPPQPQSPQQQQQSPLASPQHQDLESPKKEVVESPKSPKKGKRASERIQEPELDEEDNEPQFVEPPRSARESSKSEAPKMSVCMLNDAVSDALEDPKIMIYSWINDLMSDETGTAVPALKAISAQLKKDEAIFKNHLDALMVLLLSKVHTNFAMAEPPTRFCKYIAFCLLTLFSETKLSPLIPKEYIQQLLYEMMTHLTNGTAEGVLNQVMNAIIIKVIEDCSMFAFMGLLAAIGEYEGDWQRNFSEKWLRLAIKCFEAAGARICELGNQNDIFNSFALIDQFFEMHDKDSMQKSQMGLKAYQSIKNYGELVMKNYNDVITSKDNLKKLGPNSVILHLLNVNVSQSSSVQSSGHQPSRLKPLRGGNM